MSSRAIMRDPIDGPFIASRSDPRALLILSVLLGIVFGGGWLGYTASTAEDGRRVITDWLDPMLAGATITIFLLAQLTLVVGWEYVPGERLKRWSAVGLVLAGWVYIGGEVLSNTITIGEPPGDIGSILEIVAGMVVLVTAITLGLAAFSRVTNGGGRWLLGGMAVVFFIGMLWWFSHPVDQSRPGAPSCIPDNPLYNAFHRSCDRD